MSIASDQWPRRHLIDVEQYYRMAEVGLLAPDARVELIEGVIIDTAPIGSNHAGVVTYVPVISCAPPARVAVAALPQIQLELAELLDLATPAAE